MKRKIGLSFAGGIAVCAVVLCGCGGGEKGLKAEYRMQVNVGANTYWGMGATKFAEIVAERTGGKIKVKPYFGSQLLKGAQLNSAQMVSTGAIDCAFESTINTAPVIPAMNVFSLPFFINTYENLDRLENGETGKHLFEEMRRKGLEPLAWGENGFRQVTNSRRAVKSPEDLRGLRVRVVGSPIFVDIFRQLGADPINMNWGDAITAFQQGTIDGQENPAGILTAVQIHQYHKHVTFWNYVIDPLVLYWNKKQWKAFPQEIRTALTESARLAATFEKALSRAGLDGEESLNILRSDFAHDIVISDPMGHMRRKGMEVTLPSDEQIERFGLVVKPVFDKWAENVGPELVEAARKDMAGNGSVW